MTKEGEFGSVIYRLNVFSTVGGGLLQTIDVPMDAFRSIVAGDGLEVAFEDFNYDGYLDFQVLFFSGNKKQNYNYWIWDREKEIFERADKLFGKLSTFCYDSTTKQFYDYEYTSPYPFGRDKKVYEIRQGELVLVKRMVIDYGDPTKITVSKYESGKKKVLYKATVIMEECYRSNEYRKASQFFERE